MNAVIYTRISSTNQSKINNSFLSLDTQKDICRQYCLDKGYVIDGVIREVRSGREIHRQTELLDIINNCSNTNLVISDITRFTRDSINGIKYLYLAKKKGIFIHFVNDGLISNNITSLNIIRKRISDALYESDLISLRVRKNNETLKKRGWYFGTPKFGYKITFKNQIRKKTKCAYEQNIINLIIELRKGKNSSDKSNLILKKILPNENNPIVFIDNDNSVIKYFDQPYTLSFQEIADLLNEYNIKNRTKQWTASSINRIYNSNTTLTKLFSNLTM